MSNAYRVIASRPAKAKRCSSRRYSRFASTLLEFFALYRTALASQVHRQLIDQLPTDRVTRLHLQTLVAAGELEVIREPGINSPNVYVVTRRGLRAMDSRHVFDTKPRTRSHVAHELLITEVAVSLKDVTRLRADIKLCWQERFALAQHTSFRELVPDYAFLFQHDVGRLLCLVEVSSGEESATRLGQKLHKFADWAESPEGYEFIVELYRQCGAAKPRPQFRLLVVAENRRSGNDATRVRQVFGEAMRLPRGLRRRSERYPPQLV
ncbi:MAG: replication-relaxation family protein [Planctomycetes bacterium]|nr:replication-relaxation family protein [Planctomycetota bacterium]